MPGIIVERNTLRLSFDKEEGMYLLDQSTGQEWLWPAAYLGAVKYNKSSGTEGWNYHSGYISSTEDWSVNKVSAETYMIRIELSGAEGSIVQTWTLESEGVDIQTVVKKWINGSEDVRIISPGLVQSSKGSSPVVVPVYQGILHNKGEYSLLFEPGSHGKYQLGFSGLLGQYGGLSAMVDLNWDHNLFVDARSDLEDRIAFIPKQVFEAYAESYHTYYKICNSTVYDLAQTYRNFKIAKDQFKSWEEKLKITPGLEQMFGSPHFFIGYFESEHNYLQAMNSAKIMGFDTAFVYPTVFRSYQPEMKLRDGVSWIDISVLHEDIKKLGYHIASWTWSEEIAISKNSDIGTWGILGTNQAGDYAAGWSTGDYQWYRVAGDAQVQFMQWAQKNMWPELSAQHFDVTGNLTFIHKYGQKLFNNADDVQSRRDLFDQASVVGPVSTEGFCDGFQQSIHSGSVIAFPSWGEKDWWTIPLNSIIFHDSAMNVWWECDSYNNPQHQQQHHRDEHLTPAGGGKPMEQSLWDALQGTPPNIFLCGKMYRPVNKSFSEGYEFYEIGFEDDLTQEALKLAKPIADHHKKIGKQQIIGYDILSKDGQVQRTKFKDGTTVTVNFGKTSWTDGIDVYEPETWVSK